MAKKVSITQMPAVIFAKFGGQDEFKIVGSKTTGQFFENEKVAETFVRDKITEPAEIKIFALRKHLTAKSKMQIVFGEIDLKNLDEEETEKVVTPENQEDNFENEQEENEPTNGTSNEESGNETPDDGPSLG
jgi:hypothetical protein